MRQSSTERGGSPLSGCDRDRQGAAASPRSGSEARVYPRTDGVLCDNPFSTVEVDEAEILELEREM